MNTLSRTISVIAAAASFLLGTNAFATAWGDSSTSTSYFYIESTDTNAPTVLRTVTVKCPKAGRLMAFAVADFALSADAAARVGVLFSITNTTRFDLNHYYTLYQDVPGGLSSSTAVPASMQRTDACTAGQTVTYRFVATLGTASTTPATYAWQPRLNVIFVDTII